MLELEWPNIHKKRDGSPNHPGYVSGELFGAGGMRAVPENPRGSRSMSFEMRCKGKGEWNQYVIVAVDGAVKLSINGKFVNGIREADLRKGYLCSRSRRRRNTLSENPDYGTPFRACRRSWHDAQISRKNRPTSE